MIKQVEVKSVLNKMKKRDSWFLVDYSVNPYSSCAFNCVYCYVRGSKYGSNMSRSLSVKSNCLELLEKQLKRRADKGQFGIIALGSSTDPYVTPEKDLKLTRRVLEIILKYRFPLEVATKSPLILRDMDLLEEIDKAAILPSDLKGKIKHGAILSFSFSNVDEGLAKIFEPGAPLPKERLEAMRECKSRGLYVGANLMPVLPFITDSKEYLENMISTVKEYGADYIFVGGLTLFGSGPADCKTLYYKTLQKHFPDLAQKTKSLFRIFFFPPKDYQTNIDKIAKNLSKKYSINYGLT